MSMGIFFLFISSIATSVVPYFFGKVIDYAIPKTNWLVAHCYVYNIIIIIIMLIHGV